MLYNIWVRRRCRKSAYKGVSCAKVRRQQYHIDAAYLLFTNNSARKIICYEIKLNVENY